MTAAVVSVNKPRSPVSNGVLGILIFIVCEAMMFAGFISAFTIVRAGTLPVLWPPPNQPRLPANATLLNTAALLVSGALVLWAYRRRNTRLGKDLLAAGFGLGAAFVALQGVEWLALLRQGLTLRSSALGSFFYLIVGAHALHAVVALGALAWAWLEMKKRDLPSGAFATVTVFWTFVVVLWPVIYLRVYF
ncbi:MAG: heme-copper oxidase subunit III [Myxococcaceae bacterium]